MEQVIKKYNILTGIFIFVCIPILLYILDLSVYRTALKEFLSLITIIAFSLIFSQFFISRINDDIQYGNKINKVLNFHKYLGYIVISILFFHPFFIVLPRFFEAGIEPLDAFVIMITSFDNFGIVLGIISWFLMLTIGITSFLRYKLGLKYKSWKTFHGIISALFIVLSTWHMIELGRHSLYAMSIFFILLVFISIMKLSKNLRLQNA